MPQVVNLPSRGISVNFPDDATPEEIQEALDEYYPRNGADVAHDIATERNFHLKGMSLDDYEMLRGHEGKIAEGKGALEKTMEATGMLAEDIGSGLKAAYRAAKKGQYGPTLSGSLNVGRDIAVGGLTGTYDLGEVIHGIFEVEDAEDTYSRHLSENDLKDTPEARKDYRSRLANDFKDFKKKMDRADFRQGIIDLAVVPEAAHASSYLLDASLPVTFGMGALAKAPAMAATKTAGRTVGQVVGGGFRQAGRAATVAGEVPEKVAGKLLGEGAEATVKTHLPSAAGIGVVGGSPIAAMPAAAKAVGSILDVAGDVLESASRAAAEGGRKGAFARSAELAETTAGKNISELLARVETPLSYAGEAIKGAGAGMAIGGTLGGLAEGEEGFWHGIGVGGPLGIGGSLAGRAVGDAFGVRRAALSYDDAKKYLSSHRDAHYAIKALDKLSPADAAHLADSVMHMETLGVKVTFHDDNVPPPALSPEKVARKSYSGVMVDESGVFINTDRVTESTGLHEAFHATAYAMERGKFLGEVQGMLLGKTDPVEGLIVRPGALSMENFAKFVESYAGMMESSAARLRVAGDEIGAAKLEVQSMEFRRKVAEGDLQHAVDEFGAFYWDAFVRGEEPKLFIGGEKDLVVNALNWAKKKASKAFMRDAQKAGLDFSQGTQAAFIRGKQRQFAIPEFDAAIRRLVKNGDMEVTHNVPVTGIPKAQAFALAKLHGAEHLFEVNDKGEPVRVKTIKEIETESKADVETALDAIEVLPDNVRRSEIVVDEKGRRKLVARNLSNEEKAVLLRTVRHMNNSQRQQLEAFVAGMDSPDGKPVYKVSYWKASGAGRGKRKPYGQFEVSERDALPYSLEMNATGGLYLRFVDMDSVNGNLLKARRLKVYKNLHSSHREAVAEFHSYLENLDSDSPIPSAEFFGGGEVGRLKRNLFYEALGTVPRKDDPPLHNMGREGYTPKRGRNFAFKNLRVERLGNVEDTGVRVKFGESAYERSIVNMLPDESPARFMPDDSAYADAANRGDTDTAQRMVDQAAKAAGYTIGPFYHGSGAKGITSYRTQSGYEWGPASYWTPEPGRAARYGEYVQSAYLKIEKPLAHSHNGPDGAPLFDSLKGVTNNEKNAEARRLGYDGVINMWGDGSVVEAAAFDPNQIKSADPITRDDAGNIIPLSERFKRGSDDIRYMPDVGGQDSLGMFSAAERATVDLKQEKGGASQMLAMIKKAGVKDEELQALGLDKFLEGNRKVTKDEIIDHLVENSITVEETVLGGPDIRPKIDGDTVDTVMQRDLVPALESIGIKGSDEAASAIQKRHLYELRGEPVQQGGAALLADHAISKLEEHGHGDLLQKFFDINKLDHEETVRPPATKHASYVEPGAVEGSYRELLLRLPEKTDRSGLPEGYSLVEGTGLKKWEVFGPGTSRYSSGQTKAEAIGSFWDMHGKAADYTGGHYGEHPNVLAHVRFNDRTSEHGKTLFIEEIQSDWHQEGRKKGYQLPPERKAYLENRRVELEAIGKKATKAQKQEWVEVMNELQPQATGRVPDAPFKTSWHELSMKRMIRYAVDNGYDAISWTKGETQAARYDLSKQVKEIAVPSVEPNVRAVRIEPIGGNSFKLMVDNGGKVEGLYAAEQFTGKQLDEVIGKEMAEKVMAFESPGKLTGLDLKVGGEGMKGFYDRMLPKMKTWKKLGLKVEGGVFDTGDFKVMKKNFQGGPYYSLENRNSPDAISIHPTAEAAWAAAEALGATPAHLVKLTPEVKAKVLDTGIARFMPDAAVPGAERNSIGWSMLLTKAGNWRVYGPDGVLAGVAGSKQRAEQIFKTKYKRELRKKERSSSVRYMPDARSEYRAAEIPHRSSVPGVPDGVELRLPTVETTTGSVGKGIILHFSAYPSGRYGAMRYGVAATEANRFPSDAKGEMPKGGGYDSVWDERYNRSYDSEQKWRAAHARYAKKNEIISDPWYESAIRVEEEIKRERAK